MTVPVQIPFTTSTANGLTTVFPYGFKIAATEDLAVTVDGVRLTSGYTVSGVGDPAGGNVTITPAPANGAKVVRYLAPILKRETDYQQFGDWMAAIVNLDLDRIWLALQTLQQNDVRSLKLPVDTSIDQVISQNAAERVGKVVSFDALGNMTLSVPTDLPLNTVSAFIGTLLDDADAASARTTLGAQAVMNSASQAEMESGTEENIRAMSPLRVAQAIAMLSASVPAGSVIYIAKNTAPTGYLKANGSAVSRATYSALFSAIGTTFGAGDGSTTFNVPDLRGEFLRCWDDSRGIDSGRMLGSAQAGTQMTNGTSSSNSAPKIMPVLNGTEETGTASVGTNTASEPGASTGTTFKTRPRNIALLACIKY